MIGTSSVRRVAQLRRQYPKLQFADVRGLVQTRLRKLDDPEGQYAALILASAGLIRLGLNDRITAPVTSPALYHAVGQGAICIEIREGDERSREVVGSLECWKSGWMGRAERSMLHYLEGGCSVPVGCESSIEEIEPLPVDDSLVKAALVNSANGSRRGSPTLGSRSSSRSSTLRTGRDSPHPMVDDDHSARITLTGTVTSLSGQSSVLASHTANVYSIADCEALGKAVARELIAKGADEILRELGRHVKEVQGEGGLIPKVPNNGVPSHVVPEGAKGLSDGRSPINMGPTRTASAQATAEHDGNRLKDMGLGEQTLSGEAEAAAAKAGAKTTFGAAGEKCQRPQGW